VAEKAALASAAKALDAHVNTLELGRVKPRIQAGRAVAPTGTSTRRSAPSTRATRWPRPSAARGMLVRIVSKLAVQPAQRDTHTARAGAAREALAAKHASDTATDNTSWPRRRRRARRTSPSCAASATRRARGARLWSAAGGRWRRRSTRSGARGSTRGEHGARARRGEAAGDGADDA
jgi:hypothetical protein